MTPYRVDNTVVLTDMKSTTTLKRARLKAGLTQEELEIASGVNQATISGIENGRVLHPTFATVCRLADALHLDPRDLRFEARDKVLA